MEQSHAPFVRRVFQELDLPRDAWYLDIGCGNGYTVRWAAGAAPQGKAVGLDLSAEMVARARTASAGLPNVEYLQAAFPSHNLPHGRFDVVFSMEVLYYLPDLNGAVQEVQRLLKPGGLFACMVDYYQENAASHGWPTDVGLDMTLLDEAGWRRMLEDSGLGVIEQRRVRLPPEEASESWNTTEGSLLTLARRPD